MICSAPALQGKTLPSRLTTQIMGGKASRMRLWSWGGPKSGMQSLTGEERCTQMQWRERKIRKFQSRGCFISAASVQFWNAGVALLRLLVDFFCRGENLGQDCVNIRIGSTVIYDAGAKTEFRLQSRIREIDAAARYDPPKNLEIDSIELAIRQIAVADIPKA